MRSVSSPPSMYDCKAVPLVPGARALVLATALALALGLGAPGGAAAKTLGIIYPESCVFYDAATDALKSYLAGNGLGPGQLEIFVQKPAADQMSWTNAVRKFAAVEADLIVVWGDTLLQTACREKVSSPVGFGFVLRPGLSPCARSAANPSGTAMGVSAFTPLQTLLAKARLMTDFKTVAAMSLPEDRVGQALIEELRSLERELGFSTSVVPVAKREEAAAVFRDIPAPGLFLLPGCPLAAGQVEEILTAAAQKRIPTVSLMPPRSGAIPLLSLYPNPEEQGRLLGEQAVQVLKGGAPAAALLTPKKIELEVNLPLAKQLGVKAPMSLLETATKIVK